MRDENGQAVANLTKDDFELFDKGKRQAISSFSVLQEVGTREDTKVSVTPKRPDSRPPEPAAGSTALATPQRSRIYLFDDLNTDFSDLASVREAAAKHFQHDFVVTDRAAIWTTSGRPTLDFTEDRDKLVETAQKVRAQLAYYRGQFECPNITYYLADLILNVGDKLAFEVAVGHTVRCAHVLQPQAEAIVTAAAQRQLILGAQDTRIVFGTIRRAIRRLADMPGQRTIILASPGFYAQTPDGTRAMAEVLDLAAKASVTISGLDPHGVDHSDADASERREPYLPWIRYTRETLQENNDTILDLVGGTGGTFFRRNNDLKLGFSRVTAAPEVSYILGFSPTNLKADGSFHALKIRLPGQKGFKVQARHGYFAQQKDSSERAERAEVDDAVLAREETHDIPVILQTGYSKLDASEDVKVLISAKIDLGSLHYKAGDGRNRGSLTVVSALFSSDGAYLTGTLKTVNLNLRDETIEHLDPGVTLRSEFKVKRGGYVFRLVIHEVGGTAMTALTRTIMVP